MNSSRHVGRSRHQLGRLSQWLRTIVLSGVPRIKSARQWEAVSIVVAGLILVTVFQMYREPTWRGVRLSTYLEAFAQDGTTQLTEPSFGLAVTFQPSAARSRAWEALPHFGTNSIPTLIEWLQARDSSFDKKLAQLRHWLEIKFSLRTAARLTDRQKRQAAITAFSRLGRDAEPALPLILPLLNDPRSAREAIFALSFIVPSRSEDILALTNALAFPHCEVEAMAALASFGDKSSRAAAVLRRRLESTNAAVRGAAAATLARISKR